jgi:hypothetical protein
MTQRRPLDGLGALEPAASSLEYPPEMAANAATPRTGACRRCHRTWEDFLADRVLNNA